MGGLPRRAAPGYARRGRVDSHASTSSISSARRSADHMQSLPRARRKTRAGELIPPPVGDLVDGRIRCHLVCIPCWCQPLVGPYLECVRHSAGQHAAVGLECRRHLAGRVTEGQWGHLPNFGESRPGSRGREIMNSPSCQLAEAGRELLDDPVAEHVGHVEDVPVHLVVGGDVCRPLALKPSRLLRLS